MWIFLTRSLNFCNHSNNQQHQLVVLPLPMMEDLEQECIVSNRLNLEGEGSMMVPQTLGIGSHYSVSWLCSFLWCSGLELKDNLELITWSKMEMLIEMITSTRDILIEDVSILWLESFINIDKKLVLYEEYFKVW